MNMRQSLLPLAILSLAALPLGAQTTASACIDKIKNQDPTPFPFTPCLKASSDPTLGMLYPLGFDFNVDAYGSIASGKIGPYRIGGQLDARILTLDCGASSTFGGDAVLELARFSSTSGVGNGTLQFINSHNTSQKQIAVIQAGTAGSTTDKGGNIQFFTKLDGSGSGVVSRMMILDNGNVGIGTQNPTSTLDVVGTVSAAVKNFRIDHPLDPANKTLTHACIESSEMMNLYRGNAVLDGFGAAEVEMPEWFEALNQDFSYQLTAIGAPAPGLYVADELQDGRFLISGGSPGMKVSWLVTGVRHDAYALAHPLEIVQDKGTARGTLLYPKELEEPFLVAPR